MSFINASDFICFIFDSMRFAFCLCLLADFESANKHDDNDDGDDDDCCSAVVAKDHFNLGSSCQPSVFGIWAGKGS